MSETEKIVKRIQNKFQRLTRWHKALLFLAFFLLIAIINRKIKPKKEGFVQNKKYIEKNGNDVLNGKSGEDYLHGGKSFDIITGGNGADMFKSSLGLDRILDFEAGVDRIIVDDINNVKIRRNVDGILVIDGHKRMILEDINFHSLDELNLSFIEANTVNIAI